MIAAPGLVLALAALLIIYIDPAEPDRYVTITYTTFVLYVLYSATPYTLALRRSRLMQSTRSWAHWVSAGWYTPLSALSSGTNSSFFGRYYSILVASFRWGFGVGLWATPASTVLFPVVGLKSVACAMRPERGGLQQYSVPTQNPSHAFPVLRQAYATPIVYQCHLV
jgi:hypothetical protein